MKNKWLIIAVVVVLIALVGLVGYKLMSSNKTVPQAKTQTTTQTAQPQTMQKNAVRGTILSLLDGGKTVTCTVTLTDNKGTGTFYVASAKKFAGDINSVGTDNKPITTHMVSDGPFVYIWSAAMPMGIKMNLSAARNAANNAQTSQSFDMSQNVDMQCNPWIVDESKFTVPANVNFTDMSNLTNPAGSTTVAPKTGAGTTGTSPCDAITNPTAKAACQNALKSQGY